MKGLILCSFLASALIASCSNPVNNEPRMSETTIAYSTDSVFHVTKRYEVTGASYDYTAWGYCIRCYKLGKGRVVISLTDEDGDKGPYGTIDSATVSDSGFVKVSYQDFKSESSLTWQW